MSISITPDHVKYATVVQVTSESYKNFKELVQRGANLWPDAPPEIKEFADLVTTGKVLQDYRAQAGNSSKAKTD